MDFIAFGLIGGLFVAAGLAGLAFRRAIQRHRQEAALHAPLLDRCAVFSAVLCSLGKR